MRNFLATIGIFLVIGAVGWQAKEKFFPALCAEPIPYTLGNFDARFNISKTDLISALEEAERVWEEPMDKDLFVYVPDDTGAMKINLIYDFRQAATKNLTNLGLQVKETQASYDELRAKLADLKSDFERDQRAFESSLNQWNRSPRTDREEFNRLEAIQDDLNRQVDEINSLITVLNRLASRLNLTAEKFNTINAERGETFEEGLYVREGDTQYINVYEFESRDKLLRVLAHEFGHALDLPHIADPNAIMYEINQSSAIEASASDLALLKAHCDE